MNKKRHPDFGIVFWLHMAIVVLALFSPLLFSWPWLLLAILIYFLQLIIFGDCVITTWQFGTRNQEISFTYYYICKLGIKLGKKSGPFFLQKILPGIVIAIAFVIQVFFNFKPLFF